MKEMWEAKKKEISSVEEVGKVPALPTQAQAVASAQPQSANGPSSVVPAFSRSHWSQLILGASLIASAGAGTGYLVQKVLAPKLRAWLRDLVLEGELPTESKKEGQGKSPRPAPLKEVVGAAAAAAAAAAEVASSSHLPKLQAEEWQQLRSLIKTLESKTEELKGTLTLMSKNFQDAEEHLVSAAHTHAESASFQKGTEQLQMKHGVQVFQSAPGVGMTQSYSQSTNFNNVKSQSEEKPWWGYKTVDVTSQSEEKPYKTVDVETHGSPKQRMESTLHVSEVEEEFDQ
ncbi:hypothetical protein L7F22_053159 [Adiantum nelumboides]|nr:hypothetical protein [Adiantum nelumboides]